MLNISFKVIYVLSVHPPHSAGGLSLLPNFQKRGPDRILIFFRGRLLKRGGDVFEQEEGGILVFT